MIHFVDENAQGPVIDGFSVAFIEQNLGSDIFWGSAEGVGSVDHDFGEPEIGQFQVSEGAHQQILGLQVSVYDVHAVHVVENMGHLRRVETNTMLY